MFYCVFVSLRIIEIEEYNFILELQKSNKLKLLHNLKKSDIHKIEIEIKTAFSCLEIIHMYLTFFNYSISIAIKLFYLIIQNIYLVTVGKNKFE